MSAAEVRIVLSESDRLRLEACESVIAKGYQTYIEIGEALKEIRDLKLYRVTHPTLEAYGEERWGMKRQRVYDFIEAASTVQNVRLTDKLYTTNLVNSLSVLPDKTAALELAKLPDAEQAKAWDQVIEETDGKPTVKATREVVERSKPKPTKFVRERQQPTVEAEDESQDVPDDYEQREPEPVRPKAEANAAKARAERGLAADHTIEVEINGEATPAEPERGDAWEEESDESWLASLPLSSRLTGLALKKFQSDALSYKRMKSARDAIRHHKGIAGKGLRTDGEYLYHTTNWLTLADPSRWILCPAATLGGCGGEGYVVLTTGKLQCKACQTRGYSIDNRKFRNANK